VTQDTPKKILFVIDSLSSGGAEKSLTNLLSLLDERKYSITLLVVKKGGLYEAVLPDSVRYEQIPMPSMQQGRVRKVLFSLLVRLNVWTGRKIHPAQLHWFFCNTVYAPVEQSYDVAIAYSQGFPTYYVASKVVARKKYCWLNTNYQKAGYIARLDRLYYQQFHKVIAVSNEAKKQFLTAHKNADYQVDIIYDIMSAALVKKMANSQNPYHHSDVHPTKILTIGRLVVAKGYDIALNAAKILHDRGVNFHWYIIGEGDLASSLKQMVDDLGLAHHITFLGVFPNPYPYIKYADIYCQSSRFEGFGLAIAEARILHKPVVATHFQGVEHQITHQKNGLIANMDPISLADNIQSLIETKSLYQTIVNNLQQEVVDSSAEIKKWRGY